MSITDHFPSVLSVTPQVSCFCCDASFGLPRQHQRDERQGDGSQQGLALHLARLFPHLRQFDGIFDLLRSIA
jgi:hypothetical protein